MKRLGFRLVHIILWLTPAAILAFLFKLNISTNIPLRDQGLALEVCVLSMISLLALVVLLAVLGMPLVGSTIRHRKAINNSAPKYQSVTIANWSCLRPKR